MVVCLCADEGSGAWSVLGRGEKEAVSAGPRGLCVFLRRCAVRSSTAREGKTQCARRRVTRPRAYRTSASELCFSKCKMP